MTNTAALAAQLDRMIAAQYEIAEYFGTRQWVQAQGEAVDLLGALRKIRADLDA